MPHGLRAFGERIEDIKPVIQPGSSDSAALDAVFELMVRAGRDAADGQDHADPRGLGAESRHAPGAQATSTPTATR